jgi:hypothetical protein
LREEDRPGFLAQVAVRLAERVDRRGTRQASALLSLATGLPETAAQSALVLLLADCGFPRPVCQYQLWAGGRQRYRLDFAWPESRVALECDEESGAGAPSVRAARDDALRRQGWLVVRAEMQDLVDPTALCGRLRAVLRERRQAA